MENNNNVFGGIFSFLLAYSRALRILGDRLERLEIVQFFSPLTLENYCVLDEHESKLLIFFFYKDYFVYLQLYNLRQDKNKFIYFYLYLLFNVITKV